MSERSLWLITKGQFEDSVIAVFSSRDEAIDFTPHLIDFDESWANYYLSELELVTDDRGSRWEVDWMKSVHMRELS